MLRNTLHNKLISMKNLSQEEQFSKEDIKKASIIIHPNQEWYNIKTEDISNLFEEWSNFTPLKNPIKDEFGNEFRNSEWYYMAQRTKNKEIKKMIAFLSLWYWLAKKSTKLFPLEQDEDKRIKYMRSAIKNKFDNNSKLKEKLMSTWDKKIIEYTYRNDRFFGIDQNTLKWKNILWKLLMEYRDNNK